MTLSSDEQQAERRSRELPWRRLGGLGVAALVAFATVLAAAWSGAGLGLLVLGGAALLAAIAALWTSVRTLFGEVPMDVEDAYALAAPAGTDDQKRALLRTLEDLEYERRVGKISDQDFGELGARLRTEAKRLLGVQAGAPTDPSEAAEGEHAEGVAEQAPVKAAGDAAGPSEKARSESPAEAEEPSAVPSARPSQRSGGATPKKRCAACGSKNDADAQFCKKCGTRLEARSGRSSNRKGRRAGRRKP